MRKNSPHWLLAALFVTLALALFASAQKKRSLPPHAINLNTATTEELQKLPGIGPTLAKAIVNVREKSGPFRRVEDLLAVPRITRRTIEKIRPYVRVEP
jgi:competence protein ComEA